MKNRMITTIVSLLSMIVALSLAWGLDHWVEFLRRRGIEDFSASRSFWGITLANWMIAIAVFWLIWLVYSIGKNSLIGWCYFVIGLVLSLYPVLRFTLPLYEILPVLRFLLYSPNTYLAFVATFIAIMGGITLFRPERVKT
jgi:hypothetical protein